MAKDAMFLTEWEQDDKDRLIQELKEENEILKKILDHVQDGIYLVDGREQSYGNTIYCNPVHSKYLGVQTDEIIGKNIGELKETLVSQQATPRSKEENKPVTLVQTMLRTNRKALVTSTPIFNESDELVCFFIQAKDLYTYEHMSSNTNDIDVSKSSNIGPPQGYLEEKEIIIAEDEITKHTLGIAERLAKFDSGILLTGETGVGKEVFAKYIHDISPRRKGPFVTVNCATFQKELIESELFGYESGAFTGAKKGGKIGLFEAARGGTLFLDEINSLALDFQGKLLRAIETKKIRAVGSNNEYDVDFRLIVATNEKLEDLMKKGVFREDLYYRINVFSIFIPSLRERKKDIAALLRYFTLKYANKYGITFELSDLDIARAQAYSWPGNIRELKNFAEQLVVLGATPLLSSQSSQTDDNELVLEIEEKNNEKEFEKEQPKKEAIPMIEGTLKEKLNAYERELIKEALEKYHYKRDVAEKLGIDPSVLSRKIVKYEL